MKKTIFTLLGLIGLFAATPALAVQITVPSAPSAGYALLSTSTGAYVATTTTPLHIGSLFASSTTDLSTFMGQFLVNGSSTLQNFTFRNATGTNATTTNFYVSSNFWLNAESFTDLTGTGLSNTGGVLTNSGVTSISGTAPIVNSLSTGAITLSCPTCLVQGGANQSKWATTTANANFIQPNSATGIIAGLSTTTSATTTNFSISSRHLSIGTNQTYITGTTSPSFNIASTTLDAYGKSMNIGTSTFLLKNFPESIKLIGAYCTASSSGTALLQFTHDNGNATETITCGSGSYTAFSTNNTWTSYEAFNVKASSTAPNQVQRVTVTAIIQKTSD